MAARRAAQRPRCGRRPTAIRAAFEARGERRRGRRGIPCATFRRVAKARARPMMGALIRRDVRRGFTGAAWLPIAFFLLVAALMPFAIGPDARLLARIGPGALWIAALTAALLPVERLVEPDRADGVLDQLFLHGMAEESIAFAKIAAHWMTFAPLLLIAAVPASALLAMDGASLGRAEIALAIGTPGLAALAVAVA